MRRPLLPSCVRTIVPAAALLALSLATSRRAAAEEATPALDLNFLQYGAAFTAEGRINSAGICPPTATAPCIIGSGGGVTIRVGHRWESGWMLGGAYEFAKLNAANLLNLPIFQSLRADARYYMTRGSRVALYASGGAGAAAYGNEWSVDTYGLAFTGGVGLEYESTREVFVGLAPSYRIINLRSWTDHAGQYRPGGLAQFVGLEITLEVRSPFARY